MSAETGNEFEVCAGCGEPIAEGDQTTGVATAIEDVVVHRRDSCIQRAIDADQAFAHIAMQDLVVERVDLDVDPLDALDLAVSQLQELLNAIDPINLDVIVYEMQVALVRLGMYAEMKREMTEPTHDAG
jgi:hypothetical protein